MFKNLKDLKIILFKKSFLFFLIFYLKILIFNFNINLFLLKIKFYDYNFKLNQLIYFLIKNLI